MCVCVTTESSNVTSKANSKAEKSVPQPISHANCPEVYFLGFIKRVVMTP